MLRRILSQQSAALLPRAAVTSIAARMYATEGVDLKDLIRQEKEAKRAAEAARSALKKKLEAERKASVQARKEKASARKAEKREKAVAYRARCAAALARRKEVFAQRRAAMKIRKEKAAARKAEEREKSAAIRIANKEKDAARKAEAQKKSARAALLARPWKKQGKLATSPPLLYVSEKMKTYVRPAGEKPFDALLRFRREYQTLSAEQKAPYEQKAAANRAARKDAKAKVKGVRASPYAIFFQENYEAVSKTVTEADRTKRLQQIMQAMSARWKSLSDAQKGEYKAKAAARKAAAEKAVEEMLKQ